MPSALYHQCEALPSINGWRFGGIDDGLPFWGKDFATGKHGCITLLHEDLSPENAAYMMQHDLTRSEEVVRKFQAKWRRAERNKP